MNGTYLALDLGSAAIPMAYAFTRRSGFSRRLGKAFAAITAAAIPFLIWDVGFTRIGVWGFNPDYLLGLSAFGLPVEEILFFFCIPFACLFLHDHLHRLTGWRLPAKPVRLAAAAAALASLATAALHPDKAYTVSAFSLAGLCCLAWSLGALGARTGSFAVSFLFILLPFFLVNGTLTALPVVWYDDARNLGIRIGTIPVEDMAYCLAMLFPTVWIFDRLERRPPKRQAPHRSTSQRAMEGGESRGKDPTRARGSAAPVRERSPWKS